MKWRLFRLPGSREVWHVDLWNGKQSIGTTINVRGFKGFAPCKSIDIGGENIPRAWIEFDATDSELHIINGVAIWTVVAAVATVADAPVVADAQADVLNLVFAASCNRAT